MIVRSSNCICLRKRNSRRISPQVDMNSWIFKSRKKKQAAAAIYLELSPPRIWGQPWNVEAPALLNACSAFRRSSLELLGIQFSSLTTEIRHRSERCIQKWYLVGNNVCWTHNVTKRHSTECACCKSSEHCTEICAKLPPENRLSGRSVASLSMSSLLFLMDESSEAKSIIKTFFDLTRFLSLRCGGNFLFDSLWAVKLRNRERMRMKPQKRCKLCTEESAKIVIIVTTGVCVCVISFLILKWSPGTAPSLHNEFCVGTTAEYNTEKL